MNDNVDQSAEQQPEPAPEGAPVRPEELPPVEPPSAGYIIQLFLIPALIVAAVIGVWALFGKLADSETNWEQLVVELGSSNEHRRWRAALGLAQVLRNQQLAPETNGELLAEQPRVAAALTDLLKESLSSPSTLDEDVKHQEFLARTMGALKADDVVLPVLAQAMSADRNIEVRKSSLMSVAMIAGRHFEEQAAGSETAESSGESSEVRTLAEPLPSPTIENADVLTELKKAAQDEEPAVRHLAAYVLGLVSGPDAIKQLKVLLLDADSMAQANAAVGLSRNGSTDGVPVLISLIESGFQEMDRDAFQKLSPEEQQAELRKRQFEQPVILSNCLRAVDSLLDRIPAEQQAQVKTTVQQLLDSGPPQDIRMQAHSLLRRLE